VRQRLREEQVRELWLSFSISKSVLRLRDCYRACHDQKVETGRAYYQ
jgi:hypothetical protein